MTCTGSPRFLSRALPFTPLALALALSACASAPAPHKPLASSELGQPLAQVDGSTTALDLHTQAGAGGARPCASCRHGSASVIAVARLRQWPATRWATSRCS